VIGWRGLPSHSAKNETSARQAFLDHQRAPASPNCRSSIARVTASLRFRGVRRDDHTLPAASHPPSRTREPKHPQGRARLRASARFSHTRYGAVESLPRMNSFAKPCCTRAAGRRGRTEMRRRRAKGIDDAAIEGSTVPTTVSSDRLTLARASRLGGSPHRLGRAWGTTTMPAFPGARDVRADWIGGDGATRAHVRGRRCHKQDRILDGEMSARRGTLM
jgi:hypothetical protein